MTALARANPPLTIGILILGCVLTFAVLAPLVAPYGVAEQNILDRLQRPGACRSGIKLGGKPRTVGGECVQLAG